MHHTLITTQKSHHYKPWLIVGITVFVGLIGLGLMLSSPAATQPPKGNTGGVSSLSAEETFYDFGTISMKNGNVSKTFNIKNSTTKPLTLAKVYTSCMCTTARLKLNGLEFGPFGMPGHGIAANSINAELKPGEEAQVTAVFDPNAHGPAGVGLIERQIFVETADGGKLTLQIKADVTP